jgi:hypothetical protein
VPSEALGQGHHDTKVRLEEGLFRDSVPRLSQRGKQTGFGPTYRSESPGPSHIPVSPVPITFDHRMTVIASGSNDLGRDQAIPSPSDRLPETIGPAWTAGAESFRLEERIREQRVTRSARADRRFLQFFATDWDTQACCGLNAALGSSMQEDGHRRSGSTPNSAKTSAVCCPIVGADTSDSGAAAPERDHSA